MDNYLIDIIERMCDTTDQKKSDSSRTISWKALREAEKIKNPDFLPQLTSFIDKEKDKKKRDKAYFILGHIAKNAKNLAALNYLISRVDKETDKYIVSSILGSLADLHKPVGTDLQPLIQAIKNDKWLIRHSAIRSLNNSPDRIAETTLIEILDTSEDPYHLTYSSATLNKIGTPRAIPSLEKHLKSRKIDVKSAAKYAITAIKKRHR